MHSTSDDPPSPFSEQLRALRQASDQSLSRVTTEQRNCSLLTAHVSSWFPFVTFLPSSASRRSPHGTFGAVLDKVDDIVRFEVVDGKVHDVEGMPALLPYSVNCLVISTDPSYSVIFAVNSIDSDGCRSA